MIVKRIIEQRLSTTIFSISRLSGGDINSVYFLKTAKGNFVVKLNDKERYPNMLKKEAKGLELLRKGGISTPTVVDQFDEGDSQLIILDHIESETPTKKFWLRFADDLSKLHQNGNPYFGLDHHNYIGSLHQDNDAKPSWEKFFVEKRLVPLIKMGFDKALLAKGHLAKFEDLFKMLTDLIPAEKPSLLHGDLWSGNLLCGQGQVPVFIDPAVYYGHREVDIAMTKMFGGFDPVFLSHYHEIYPLEKGWEKRIEIHNLYPNLVHLNLFGKSYLSGIESVLNKI
ncbi:fructosamine kinase family protein [Lutimonas halocynthiae]|uniref:fructosamine kinase family protein n=1 Tax=Lutimonas halocynthiae TaxID=1446477 RepID=UPI0025B31499|nr:fructosamine kinase family protein [Lutimonas halocynthiae]MDN3641492.1 fructosamine kinase family protein [Lutimonas halocynthiae]